MPIDLNRFIATFFEEAKEHLETIEAQAMALGSGRDDVETLNTIFRAAHSIKGGSGTFGFTQLSEATHEIETLFDGLRKGKGRADAATVRLVLDSCDVFKSHLARLKGGQRDTDPAMDALREQLKSHAAPAAAPATPEPAARDEKFGLFDEPKPQPSAAKAEKFGLFEAETPVEPNRRKGDASSIRVGVDKIDRIVNLVGELVIAQAMVQQSVATLAVKADERLAHSVATLDRNTRELQQAVMSIRMMPMEFVFSRFPRLAYDVSARLGKKVHLRTSGHETELDKELIEQLIDPLTHVVRNSIDHGIESPADRVRAGKPEAGTIVMRATHRGGSVVIEVTDDGRGLDRARIIAKAREIGLPADESWSDVQAWGLIFEAGFSTAKEVTSLSGRGVGMDVVRRNISHMGGTVSVSSVQGQGTTITLQVPLTLAVLDGMIVGVGDEQYIIPLEFVAEAFKPAAGDIRSIVGQPSLVAVRGEHLPIVRLDEIVKLDREPGAAPEPICLVVEVDNRRAALLVDNLIGQQQLVVKSLDTNLHPVPGVAGATILGDGRVSLILDVSTFTRTTAARAVARTVA
ncbi:MAG: chemotaxis protein CheA [Burkholderiales bacterium]|nr:chemotaxis protein CheA [Burkholderiales bacterium]